MANSNLKSGVIAKAVESVSERPWITRAFYAHEKEQKYFHVLTYRKAEGGEDSLGEVTASTKEGAASGSRFYLCTGDHPIIPVDRTRTGIDATSGAAVFLHNQQRARWLQSSKPGAESKAKRILYSVIESVPRPVGGDVAHLKSKMKNVFSGFDEKDSLPSVNKRISNQGKRADKCGTDKSAEGMSTSSRRSSINDKSIMEKIPSKKEEETLDLATVAHLLLPKFLDCLKQDMTSVSSERASVHNDFLNMKDDEAVIAVLKRLERPPRTLREVEGVTFVSTPISKGVPILMIGRSGVTGVAKLHNTQRFLYSDELELGIACPFRNDTQ